MIYLALAPATAAAFMVCTLSVAMLCSAAARTSVRLQSSEWMAASRARWLLVQVALPPVIAACLVYHALAGSVRDLEVCHRLQHLCIDALSAHGLWSAVLLMAEALALAALGRAGIRLGRALRASRVVGKHVALLAAPLSLRLLAAVEAVTAKFGLPRACFKEVSLAYPTSFTWGFFAPICVFSSALVRSLSDAELEAVVAHEAAHAKRRDNLARVLAAAWNALTFLLPPMQGLSKQWENEAEIAADDLAVRITGRPLELASALVRVGRMRQAAPETALASAFALDEPGLVTRRVKRLLAMASIAESRNVRKPACSHLSEVVAAVAVVAVATNWLLCSNISPSLRCVIENLVRVLP